MFRAEEIEKLDRSYFNIILAEEYDVTIQSRNTGHIWYIHNPEYPGEGECIIFHKHRASQPYHQHGRARSLGQAVRSIMGHDVFQMNGRSGGIDPREETPGGHAGHQEQVWQKRHFEGDKPAGRRYRRRAQ